MAHHHPLQRRLTALRRRCRGPLARRSERVRVWFAGALIVVALAVVPLLAFVIAEHSAASGDAARRHELATRHPVSAVLRESAVGLGTSGPTSALVSWTAPDGTTRQGTALVTPGSLAGDRTTIWLGTSGNPAAPPVSTGQVTSHAASEGVVTALMGLSAVAVMFVGGSIVLDRVQISAWEREWRRVEPGWTAADR